MKPSRAELVAAVERALHTEQPVTRRPSPLSAEERLQQAVEEIERVRAELRLEAPLGEIERLADKLAGERHLDT